MGIHAVPLFSNTRVQPIVKCVQTNSHLHINIKNGHGSSYENLIKNLIQAEIASSISITSILILLHFNSNLHENKLYTKYYLK